MPLKKIPKGASKKTAQNIVSKNIATEMRAGKPRKQAIAIGISAAKRK